MSEVSDNHGSLGPSGPSRGLGELDANRPTPRLQLRWEPYTGESSIGANWCCHYELVLPLGEFDIRREIWKDGEEVGRRDELVVPIKMPQLRECSTTPCVIPATGEEYADAPYRDGAHAKWDAKVLGGLPIFVIAPSGTAHAYSADAQ